MEIKVKLFATLRLNLKVAALTIESEQAISLIELLHLVSTKVKSDIIPELIEDGVIMVGTIILMPR